jgi:hypothetical protein
MSSRVRSPPPVGYRIDLVKDPLYPAPGPIRTANRQLPFLIIGIILVLVTIIFTWPSTVEDPSEDRVFQGEVWGDLTTDGEIWGKAESPLDMVSLNHWSMDEAGELRVNVTNVSNIWLVDYSQETNVSVPCQNGSFLIIADNGGFGAYLSDLAFTCEYQEFSVSFLGDNEVYSPVHLVTSVEGHGNLVHGEYHRWDITLDDCVVVVDGIEYPDANCLFIPEGETPYVEVVGGIGDMGGIGVWSGLHPHVNGTLVVDDFLHEKDGRTQMYQSILFRGDDIFIQHSGPPQYGTGGPFPWFEQWSIEVTISADTTVSIEEATDTPLWVEAILITLFIVLVIYTIRLAKRIWQNRTPVRMNNLTD